MKTFNDEVAKAQEYVLHNIVEARPGRKCVDGRYLPNQGRGMIARPGGDCGYVMALMAVNKKKKIGLTPEQCFNAVYKVVARGEGKFCMHTDHHCDPDDNTHVGLIGCGHLAKAATNTLCRDYDVDGDEVKRFVEYARNLAEIDRHIEIVKLKGEHAEEGVLVINSAQFTVHADDPKHNHMYFIYDEKRDHDFMKKLVSGLKIPGVTFDDMKKEADIQLQATLQNLAKGLPIYTVAFSGNKPQVSFLATV